MSLIIQMEYHFSTFIAILGRTQACDMTSNIPQNVCGMAQASIGAFPPPPREQGWSECLTAKGCCGRTASCGFST